MDDVPSIERLRSDPAIGAACLRFVVHQMRRVATAPTLDEALARHTEATRIFRILRPALEQYDAFRFAKQHIKGTLSGVEMNLRWLEPARPEVPEDEENDEEDEENEFQQWLESEHVTIEPEPVRDPEDIERECIAIARKPISPLANLPEGPFDVHLLRIIESACFEQAIVVRLDSVQGKFYVYFWDPWRLAGTTILSTARYELSEGSMEWPSELRFVSPGKTLEIGGSPIVEVVSCDKLEPPEHAPIDVTGWVAIVDVLQGRMRWDYEFDPWDGSDARPALAIRGRQTTYDPGIVLRLSGVSEARLAASFSHPTFRIIEMTTQGVKLGISAEARSSRKDDREMFVVATGAEIEDDDGFRMVVGQGAAGAR